jgi:hypothetical protein
MLYDTIVCVVDSAGNKLTLDRVTEFVRLTGNTVHLIYLAPEHLIAGEVMPTPVCLTPAATSKSTPNTCANFRSTSPARTPQG